MGEIARLDLKADFVNLSACDTDSRMVTSSLLRFFLINCKVKLIIGRGEAFLFYYIWTRMMHYIRC